MNNERHHLLEVRNLGLLLFCCVFISDYTLKMEGTTDQNELCLLCEERLIESENVCVKKGMSTLVEASKKRGDDKWQKWVNLSTIQVHIKGKKRLY